MDAVADGIVVYDREGVLEKAKKLVHERFRRIGRVWVLQSASPRSGLGAPGV